MRDSSIFRRILLYSNLLPQKCRITNKPRNSVGLFIPAHTAVGQLEATDPGWAGPGSRLQVGCSSVLSLFSPLDQWDSRACSSHRRDRNPTGQTQFKPLFAPYVLISHWEKHVTWPQPKSEDGGVHFASSRKTCEVT